MSTTKDQHSDSGLQALEAKGLALARAIHQGNVRAAFRLLDALAAEMLRRLLPSSFPSCGRSQEECEVAGRCLAEEGDSAGSSVFSAN